MNGQLNQVTHGNNVIDTHSLDPNWMGRPGSVSGEWAGCTSGCWSWSTGTYQYDGAGNITVIGDDYYRYDKVSRLLEGTVADRQHRQAYDYDAFGWWEGRTSDRSKKRG